MSLKTWKAKFYPKPASRVSESQALQHSLRKWEGLTPANLKKHGVRVVQVGGISLLDKTNRQALTINAKSCALCVHHLDIESGCRCRTCPLFKAHASFPCDVQTDNEFDNDRPSPWAAFGYGRRVGPMLSLLRKALRMALAAERKLKAKGKAKR